MKSLSGNSEYFAGSKMYYVLFENGCHSVIFVLIMISLKVKIINESLSGNSGNLSNLGCLS